MNGWYTESPGFNARWGGKWDGKATKGKSGGDSHNQALTALGAGGTLSGME